MLEETRELKLKVLILQDIYIYLNVGTTTKELYLLFGTREIIMQFIKIQISKVRLVEGNNVLIMFQ